jgi:membrane protease YdiL (CAAX protease family)
VPAILTSLWVRPNDPPLIAFAGFAFAPGVAALLVMRGPSRWRSVWAQSRLPAPRVRWLCGLLLGAIAYTTVNQVLRATFHASAGWPPARLWAAAAAAAPSILVGAFCEELGWRGFLLPTLQAHASALRASAALGVVWGLWHLPLALQSGALNGSLPLWWYPAGAFTFAFAYTSVYNATGGSVLATTVIHCSLNILNTPFTQNAFDHHKRFVTTSLIGVVLNLAVAAVLLRRFGARTLAPNPVAARVS